MSSYDPNTSSKESPPRLSRTSSSKAANSSPPPAPSSNAAPSRAPTSFRPNTPSSRDYPSSPPNFHARHSRSVLRREAFLCNLIDKFTPSFLSGDLHMRHRSLGGYLPTSSNENITKGLESYDDDEEEWVLIDDIYAPGRMTHSMEPVLPIRTATKPGSFGGEGFENMMLSSVLISGPSEGVSNRPRDIVWDITVDTDVTPAVVGQPDETKFTLRRVNIYDQLQVETMKFPRIEGFDWNSEKDVAKLNNGREKWIMKTLRSNPDRLQELEERNKAAKKFNAEAEEFGSQKEAKRIAEELMNKKIGGHKESTWKDEGVD